MFLRAIVKVVVACASLPAAEPAFFFHPNDRVLFLGDSITEQYQYSSYIELYLTTRFPAGEMTFYNAGIGGDTAAGGARRFANHVLAERPTALTIDFGMNDGAYGQFDARRAEQYVKSTNEMLDAAKKAGVRVALISPNAVEVRNRPQLRTYLETQKQFYAPLKDLAAKHDVPFVDQYAITRAILEKIAADNSPVKPFPDGIHTSPAGGLLMAHTILTGLHAPAVVSTVQVEVPNAAVGAENCEVRNASWKDDRLTFERVDRALPMPVLKEWRELLPYVNRLDDLNRYGLKVTGLKEGKYELRIDDTAVGAYSAEELAAGVNVALADKGPLYEQGMKVFAAITAKNGIVHKRFRQVVMFDPKGVPEWLGVPADEVARRRQAELTRLAETIAERQAEVCRLAKPAAHRWELKRAE
jgi:lysophospholipase L1-like esterase